jgi:hypothetical protein
LAERVGFELAQSFISVRRRAHQRAGPHRNALFTDCAVLSVGLLDRLRGSSQLLAFELEAATMLAALIERVELKPDGMRLWFRVAIPIVVGQCRRGDEWTDPKPLHPGADEAARG